MKFQSTKNTDVEESGEWNEGEKRLYHGSQHEMA